MKLINLFKAILIGLYIITSVSILIVAPNKTTAIGVVVGLGVYLTANLVLASNRPKKV